MSEKRMIFGRYVVHKERFFLGSLWSFYRVESGKTYWIHEHSGIILPSKTEKGGLLTSKGSLPQNRKHLSSGPVCGDGAA